MSCFYSTLALTVLSMIAETQHKPSQAFLPYPSSTLSPPIVPNDLSSFKTRGISQVERDLQQKLVELREQYMQAVEHFNWNKLVYEARINFEPVVGRTYHLYRMHDHDLLSMIGPKQWAYTHLGSFRLNIDRQWLPIDLPDRIDPKELFT